MKKRYYKIFAIHKKDVFNSCSNWTLSDKINKLSEHFKKFKKDKHSSRGLTKSVNRRKRLLAYLSKSDPELYNNILKKLKLRK